MERLLLRKIEVSDKKYFARWWRDKGLLKLTSGVLKRISDAEVDRYFKKMIMSAGDQYFMISVGGRTIGHCSLVSRPNGWHETQIVIGDQRYQNKGYGTRAIRRLLRWAKRQRIAKIFLEVRLDNSRAIRSYEKCSFVKTSIKHYKNNRYLPRTIRMELKQ